MKLSTRLLIVALAALGVFLVNFASAQSPSKKGKGKVEVLFKGKSTDAFRGYKSDSYPSNTWQVVDGALHTVPGPGAHGDLITKEKYSDFDLTFEWKVSPGANSGVIYRVSEAYGASYNTGPEYQVLDDDKHADGKNPLTSAGSVYALIAPKGKQLKPVGQWNTGRIKIEANHVEHYVNGTKVAEYNWGSTEVKELISKSKFASMPGFMKESSGHIAFQFHGDEVWFRNIKIRRLSE